VGVHDCLIVPLPPFLEMNIFISHVSDESTLALELKRLLLNLTSREINVFVSSDYKSIIAGEEWVVQLRNALREARVIIVLCSPNSIRQPWVNFEIGGAWIKELPIIPICHLGLMENELGAPLSLYQALSIDDSSFIEKFTNSINQYIPCNLENLEELWDVREKLLSESLSAVSRIYVSRGGSLSIAPIANVLLNLRDVELDMEQLTKQLNTQEVGIILDNEVDITSLVGSLSELGARIRFE